MSSKPVQFKGYALTDPEKWEHLKVIDFQPKNFEADDVELAITHCGVCGSDVHSLTQGWGETKLPLIAGHEIVGHVTRVGDNVKEFKVGDRVGVGAQIGACLQCKACKMGYENYCPKSIDTYNAEYPDGTVTQGGYSTAIRAHQQFVFAIPKSISSTHAASMMCAGLTVFSPLKTHGAGPGKKVGVIGIGGLGHYAILWAKAMGAEVYAFTHNEDKVDDIKKLGAHHVVNTNDENFQESLQHTLDLIISTRDVFSPDTPLNKYLSMLFVHGKFITVGLPDSDKPLPQLHAFDFAPTGCLLGGSHVGSKSEAYEMLELAAKHNIKPWIEEMPMKDASKALKGVKENDVRYRYVLVQDLD